MKFTKLNLRYVRLWSSGLELNSATGGVELDSIVGANLSIITSTVRSGNYALQIISSNAASEYFSQRVFLTTGVVFTRIYLYISSLPSGSTSILQHVDGSGNALASIALTSAGLLILFNGGVSGTSLGSSSALSLNRWYCIELNTNNGGNPKCSARLDSATFASGTYTVSSDCQSVRIGILDFVSSSTLIFDDMAINDNSGSSQTSWPGVGSIIHLKPSAAGDNNTFSTQVGGTAGASNNFTRVKEVTPDDATTYNADLLSNDADDFVIDQTPSILRDGDSINVVQIGVRYSALVAALESSLKVRCKKVTGGTISKSAAITPTSVSWTTNADSAPFNYPLTLYADPDGNPWIKSTLNTAQIGYEISAGNTNASAITTIWMLVDYTSAPAITNINIQGNAPQPHFKKDIIMF